MRASLAPLVTWAIAIVLLIALAWGLEQVAYAPLETGDSYPEFSSLRADPMGAKALYESLAALPGVTVDRIYQREATGPNRQHSGDAIIELGVNPLSWAEANEKSLKEFEDTVKDGGRLVIGFIPVRVSGDRERAKLPPIETRWHLEMMYSEHPSDETVNGIPRETSLYFDVDFLDSKSQWRKFAGTSRRPTAIERTFGAGSIVLVAETYPLSNQGLRDARDTTLISRMVGPATHINFDETHFGVAEEGSIAKLMRRYRLQGAIGVLIAVAALFLWRNATSLLPPRAPAHAAAVSGRDSLEGLTALLHRGVNEKQLLETCLAEWTKSAKLSSAGRASTERIKKLKDEIARGGAAEPVDTYRAACRILSERT